MSPSISVLATRRSSNLRQRIPSRPVPAPSSSTRTPRWDGVDGPGKRPKADGSRHISRPRRIAEPHVCTPTLTWSCIGASCSKIGTAERLRRRVAEGEEGARCLPVDSGDRCCPERSEEPPWRATGRKGRTGETGDVAREARKEVVVGDREGSTGLLLCRAFRPGAKE